MQEIGLAGYHGSCDKSTTITNTAAVKPVSNCGLSRSFKTTVRSYSDVVIR